MKAALAFSGALLLAGCVTAKMYPPEQLSALERSCGLSAGEIFQDAEEPRLLFLVAPSVSKAELACVREWTRKRSLRLAYVSDLQWDRQ